MNLGLIAGYSPEKVQDKRGLANLVGLFGFALGAISMLMGFIAFVLPDHILVLSFAYALSVLGLTTWTLVRAQRSTV